MYLRIKNILKSLIPKSIIYKYENIFRYLYYQFYRGNKYYCNICEKNLRQFIVFDDGEKICPRCGSLARNRRLWYILKTGYVKDNTKILDFSPSRNIYRVLKKSKNISYLSTDFSGEFLADKKYDITQLEIDDNSFDLIICYHILEHIDNDIKAMKELYRVLNQGGTCLIQTPFKEGEIYEDISIVNPLERLKIFGQSDHIRIYSVNGLKDRLEKASFNVNILEFNESFDNKFGFKTKEFVIVAKK